MWEQLRPADIERAKRRLSLERMATLSRHAAELKDLDAEQEQIDRLEQLAAAFAEKYLEEELSGAEAPAPSEAQPTDKAIVEEASEPAPPEAPLDDPSPVHQVEQRVSPNFGNPLRRLVGR